MIKESQCFSEKRRLYPVRPFVAVSVAVLKEDRVLIILREEEVYSLPGGVVELSETLETAVLRELREEVHMDARLIDSLPPVEVIHSDEQGKVRRHMVIIPFAACWIGGEPEVTGEARKSMWVKTVDIAHIPHTPHLEETVLNAFVLRDQLSSCYHM